MKALEWLPDHSSHYIPHRLQYLLRSSLLLGLFFLVCYGKCPRHQLHFKDPVSSHISLGTKRARFKRTEGWYGATFTWNNNGNNNFIHWFKQIRGTGTWKNCLGVTHLCIMHWEMQEVDCHSSKTSNTKNLCGYPSEARNHCHEFLLVISGPRNISLTQVKCKSKREFEGFPLGELSWISLPECDTGIDLLFQIRSQLCKCIFWLRYLTRFIPHLLFPSVMPVFIFMMEHSSYIDVSLIYLISVYNIVSMIFHFIRYALHFDFNVFAFVRHLPTEWEF